MYGCATKKVNMNYEENNSRGDNITEHVTDELDRP